MEGRLKWFIDDVLNICLSVQYVKMMTYRNRFMYGAYIIFFYYTAGAQSRVAVDPKLAVSWLCEPLALKEPVPTTADDILKYLSYYFIQR